MSTTTEGFRREDSTGNAAAAAGFLTKRPGICLTVSATVVTCGVRVRTSP
jgi:thiamine pyrophosphate-dependent acetolactate synthase large subunit-like protein